MRTDNGVVRIDFAAALAQIFYQLFARFQLTRRGLTSVEIADQTDTQRDIVQIVAVDVTAIDLPPPTIAHLDFAVSRGSSITNNEMISQPVLHSSHVAMIVIENACAPLLRAAVVHDDEMPSPA